MVLSGHTQIDCQWFQFIAVFVSIVPPLTISSLFDFDLFKESGILARWLMGVTVAIAAEHPDDLHKQSVPLLLPFG